MTWSSRRISSEEKAELLARLGTDPIRRHGVISNLAYYGLFLIVVPMVGGGFLGRLLTLVGLPENPAYVAGLALATIASPLLLLRWRRHERNLRLGWVQRRQAIESADELPIYTFRPDRGWAIESEPDWPAFLFRDLEGRYLLLNTDLLQFAEPDFARDTLEVTLAPPDRYQVLRLRWSGMPVPLQPRELFTPTVGWPGHGDFTELSHATLPDAWRTTIDAA